MKDKKRKLNVCDYAFEIDGRNIVNCNLIHSVNECENVIRYADKSEEIKKLTIISVEIIGVDMNTESESWFSFELKMNLEELNSYSEIPVNIIDKVYDGESFIKRPNLEDSSCLDFEYPKGNKEDMYLNLSSFWVSKITNNNFIFKVCVPSEGLFCYFPISFDEK